MYEKDGAGIRHDLSQLLTEAASTGRIINVPVVARELQERHRNLRVSQEELEALVLLTAQPTTSAFEFDRAATAAGTVSDKSTRCSCSD